jgi:hypothetical protein
MMTWDSHELFADDSKPQEPSSRNAAGHVLVHGKGVFRIHHKRGISSIMDKSRNEDKCRAVTY